MQLHRNKRKTFLAAWKRSELVDKKKNWEQLLNDNTGYNGGCIENDPLQVVS